MPLSKIWLPDGNTRTPFLISKIICFLGDNQYATIYYIDNENKLQSSLVTVPLIDLGKKLIPHHFLRANKSALVNIDYILKFETKGKGKISLLHIEKDFILSKIAKAKLHLLTAI